MKDISEIDLKKYRTFAYTDISGPFDVYVNSLGGEIKVTSGFEIFNIDNGSIVAFDDLAVYGFHDCYFRNNSETRHIELTEYENLRYVFEEKPQYNFAFYIFCKSSKVPNHSLFHPDAKFKDQDINQSTFARCDFDKYGGVAFEYGRNPYNIAKVFNVLNLSGYGHIVRLEVLDDWYKDSDTHGKYTAATSLSGMIKLINDWAIVSGPPFNNTEEISLCSKSFLENIGLSNHCLEEIRNLQPETPLEYYLSGGQDKDWLSPEKQEMPILLKNFISNKCRYKSLNSLKNNHPSKPNIPQSILEQELHMYNLTIFEYCIYYGIDYNNVNQEDLKQSLLLNTENIGSVYPINEAIERLFYL